MIKNLPPVQETQETWVPSLGGEDLLEKEMATRSSMLAQETHRQEEPRGRQSMGLQKIQTQLSVMWESQDSSLPTVTLEVYGIWRSPKKGRACVTESKIIFFKHSLLT